MYKYTEQLKSELETCGCMPLFEIEVKDNKGNKEWIVCDIFFRGNSIVAQRDPVSTLEQNSKFIASSRVVVDKDLILDEHLQELHSEILNDIYVGDLYSEVL